MNECLKLFQVVDNFQLFVFLFHQHILHLPVTSTLASINKTNGSLVCSKSNEASSQPLAWLSAWSLKQEPVVDTEGSSVSSFPESSNSLCWFQHCSLYCFTLWVQNSWTEQLWVVGLQNHNWQCRELHKSHCYNHKSVIYIKHICSAKRYCSYAQLHVRWNNKRTISCS